jgi:hypothetical protein
LRRPGALGDPDRGGDVADADARIVGDAAQHARVVGEKRPAGHQPVRPPKFGHRCRRGRDCAGHKVVRDADTR